MAATLAHAVAGRILFGSRRLASPLQRGVQRLLSGPREVTFEFKKGPAAGCLFSCLSSHRYFFVREDYEADLLAPIESMVRRDSVVYDIGAHFGFWAIVLSRLCPQGKVFAFEPSPENRERLRKNVAMNSIESIHIVPFAVSNWLEPCTCLVMGAWQQSAMVFRMSKPQRWMNSRKRIARPT